MSQKEVFEQYDNAAKLMSEINTRRGGDATRLKGYYAEVMNATENNIEYISSGKKARQVVIDDNGAADAIVKYSGGNYGRKIQDKCGCNYSDFKSFITDGKYDGMIMRINNDNAIFQNQNQMNQLNALAKEHNIKIVKAPTSERDAVSFAKVAVVEGNIRRKIGLDTTAPVSAKMYSGAKKAKYIVSDSDSRIKKIAVNSSNAAKKSMVAASPALIHQGINDIAKVAKGDMSVEESVVDMAGTVGKTAASGIVSHAINKQAEKVAAKVSNKVLKQALDTNAVTKVFNIANSLKDCTDRYINGEIGTGEYLIEVVEDGVGHVINSLGYLIGDLLGGPFLGACCAYVLSSVYNKLISAFRNARLSKKRMKELQYVAEQIKMAQEKYRAYFNSAFESFYQGRQEQLDIEYERLCNSISSNNIDAFLTSANNIGKVLGIDCNIGTFEEIDSKMSDPTTVWEF